MLNSYATMLYDLNIAWSPSTSQDQLVQLLSLAKSLGYGTVALNHTLTPPFPQTPTAPFPSLAAIDASSSSSSSSSTTTTAQARPSRLPHVLHRATLPLSDPAASTYRLPSLAAAYDVLAVRPLTERAFQSACLTLDVPLISLDLAQHFPFHFRPKPCMAAVARGVRFEICYAQALAADHRGRANFIANATGLVRATRGRGFVLSSEAAGALALRAPADVVNLLSVWGLGSEKGMDGLGSIPRSVVVNEGIKRNGFRGVVDVVQLAKPEKGSEARNAKRKNGDDPPPVSKRQAKKMKLAARSTEPGKK